MAKKVNRANKVYWNDIKGAVKASGLSFRQVRRAWRSKAFTPEGARVSRPQQVRSHVKAARKQRDSVKKFKKIVKARGGKYEGGGWGGKGGATTPAANSAKTDAISLYSYLSDFGRKGYRIEYGTPGASGDITPETADDSGAAIGRDIAREIRAGMEPLMLDDPQNDDSPGWRFHDNFQIDWDDSTRNVSVLWVGPNVGGD